MNRLLFVGHSHIQAIARGAALFGPQEAVFSNATFFHLQQRRYFPHFSDSQPSEMHPELFVELSDCINDADTIISTVYGNEHNVFGLVNHPRPFDFILRDDGSTNLDIHSEFVPEKYLEDALLKRTHGNKALLSKLREMAQESKRIFHLQSPPPIPSEDHIFKYPEKYGPTLKERGVAPKYLRLKLWKLFSRIIQGYCDQSNIVFVPVPIGLMDSEGFLKEAYWNEDATHGNKLYGKQILEHLLNYVVRQEKQI